VTSKKVYFGMIGLLAFLSVMLGGILYAGNNMLVKEADELVELKLESQLLEEQQLALIQANRDIEEYSELESIAKAIVPQDKDQARTVREIVKIATEAGVSFSNISFPTSNLGEALAQPSTPSGGNSGTPKMHNQIPHQ
jgi:hypothetical protein